MSAIWGAISMSGKEIPKNHIEILKEAYVECAIDRYEETYDEGIYMGNGIQYITNEAKYETAPKREHGVYFDSDVIVDNRDELLKLVKYENRSEIIPDGDILYRVYVNYGVEKLIDVLGAFAFVAYDSHKKEIIIASDSVGNRFVHYMKYNGVLYYSSLIKPLQHIIGNCKMNERWIADFIGQDNLNMFTECEETPINGIYRVAPAQYIVITPKGTNKQIYWNPYKSKKIKFSSDEEYKKHFISLYMKCVESVLRSSGETSILLSAGYDSTSVAVLAAKILKKQGKKLYGFTSVPYVGYESEFDSSIMVDETEAVKKTEEYIDNLECSFMDMPDMNCWSDRNSYKKIVELPYKSPQNLLWMFEGYKQSKKVGARILLGGMFGNGTVSYANTQLYMRDLCRKGHFIKLYKEADAINKKHGYTKKSILLTAIKQAVNIRKKTISTKENMFARTYANQDFLKRNGAIKRLYNIQHKLEKGMYVERTYHEAMITPDIFRHYGEFALRNSLYTGVIVRDPTRDKRMIEFVLGIPNNQFTHNGYMRRLISDYMKEYMPKHILDEIKKGRQSADMKARLIKKQEEIKKEWIDTYENHMDNFVIDCDRAIFDLKDKNISDMSEIEVMRHIFTNILLEYIDENELR